MLGGLTWHRLVGIRRRVHVAFDDDLVIAATNRIAEATLVVDVASRIVRGNRSAEQMLRDGGVLRSRWGRLCAAGKGMTAKSRDLIASTARAPVRSDLGYGGAIVLAAPDGTRWAVLVAQLRGQTSDVRHSDHCLVLVTAAKIGAPVALDQLMRQQFGLTD